MKIQLNDINGFSSFAVPIHLVQLMPFGYHICPESKALTPSSCFECRAKRSQKECPRWTFGENVKSRTLHWHIFRDFEINGFAKCQCKIIDFSFFYFTSIENHARICLMSPIAFVSESIPFSYGNLIFVLTQFCCLLYRSHRKWHVSGRIVSISLILSMNSWNGSNYWLRFVCLCY